MEIHGKWSKDEDGFMDFDNPQLQRLYEVITDQYYAVYNRYADEYDEDQAFYKSLEDGYKMITDYKVINDVDQFATSYSTPFYEMDIWYELDEITGKRDYNNGFLRISKK